MRICIKNSLHQKETAFLVLLAVCLLAQISCNSKEGLNGIDIKPEPQFVGDNLLIDIEGSSSSNIWCVDSYGGIYSYNGKTWSKRESANANLLCVSSISPESVWLAGGDYDEGTGAIYFFDGKELKEQHRSDTGMIADIVGIDTDYAACIDGEGNFYLFNGDEWHLRDKINDESVHAIAATSANSMWAVSGTGNIYFYNGETWEIQFQAGCPLIDISAYGDNEVWAAGGGGKNNTGYVYHYDGNDWSEIYSSNNGTIADIEAIDNETIALGASYLPSSMAPARNRVDILRDSSIINSYDVRFLVNAIYSPQAENIYLVANKYVYLTETGLGGY